MKIKIGSWADYDFDKEDAKIAVPLILLLAGCRTFDFLCWHHHKLSLSHLSWLSKEPALSLVEGCALVSR
jgi:hypothetical protein